MEWDGMQNMNLASSVTSQPVGGPVEGNFCVMSAV